MRIKQTTKELMTSMAWGQSGTSVRRAAITLLFMVLAATGAWADDISVSDDGTEYTIKTAEGWNVFCNLLEGGETFLNKTVYLGASIEVSRMAGNGAHGFAGTFDGQNNTLTFNYGTEESPADEQFVAPFSFTVSGTSPVFRNLTIDGDIYATHTEATDHDHAGGLIAHLFGTVTIDNCVSNVRITTTGEDGAGGFVGLCENSVKFTNCKSSAVVTSDGGNNSGFVGWSRSSEYLISFDGCLFNGKLLMKDDNGGYNGGFVGWKGDGKTVTIDNCLYIPAEPAGSEELANNYSANFCRQHDDKLPAVINNCYYNSSITQYYGAVQGKEARSVTAGDNVTVAHAGVATVYSVSGITAYKATEASADSAPFIAGLLYNNVLYAGSGDNVSLTLSADREGYAIKDYQVSAGTLSGSANPYTLTIPDENVTISGALTTIDWATESEGTETAPYMIYNKDQLNLLAQRFNNGTSDYKDKYFKLGNDIIYDPDELTIDNDNDKTNDSNYEAIGYNGHSFNGHFDGDDKTVSGIRIYKGGISGGDGHQGLFGRTGSDADIRNVTLADADITGYGITGGIVGENNGTVSNCHVTATVAIHTVQPDVWNHGGIVGCNVGTVTNCTSRSTLAIAKGVTGCQKYGGIAGLNVGTLTDNIAIGAVVPATDDNTYGAICGNEGGTMARNYYRACKVASENVTQGGVGCHNSDVTNNNGAVPAFALTLDTGITTTSEPVINIDDEEYYAGTITLSGGLPDGAPEHYTYAYTVNGNAISGNTFTISADATVSIDADNLYPVDWADEGNSGDDKDHAYMIYNKDQLNLLAQRVNNGTSDYKDKYFKLGNDIIYDPDELTIDNDNDGTNDSNYEAIGGYYNNFNYSFHGHFDGDDKTVSGIRIYKGGTGEGDGYQGLFGRTGSYADIHNVTLADADITGYLYTGGIVGENNGTVSDCHVAASVFIRAVQNGAHFHGGIVGYNVGTVTNCTSRSTLAIAGGVTGCQQYGGIIGRNYGTLTGNLAIGAVVPATDDNTYGAICGSSNGGTIARNYYRACKVASENVTQGGVGCSNSDVTNNNGAVPACTLTLDTGITTTSEPVINIDDEDYYAGTITLSGDLPDGAPEHYTYAYTVNGNAISGNTFTISADATVGIGLGPADWANEGNSGDDEDHAYIIYNKDQLNLLAHRVNGTNSETANDYEGKYFKLGNDITYDPDELTIDNDNDGTNDSNYEAINGFNGHFDGDDKTVSGIRIYKGGTGDGDRYQGLFGRTGSNADIRNVTLADADITGYRYTGGIVGENNGTVSDCHVAASVFIRAVQNGAHFHGGIVGYNRGTVTNCTSRSTLAIAKGVTGCQEYGGIAGLNFGTLTDNLAIGVVVPAADYNTHGAICGIRDGIMARNYYRACKVASENVTQGGVGCDNRDVTDNNGAVPACTLTLDTGITTTSETVINIDDEDYYAGTITLGGDLPDGAPEHYTYAYTVNGNAISGNTFIISADATVGIGLGPADWANEGNSGDDEDHAYIIYNKDQLNLLAHRVNGTNSETANDYEGKYFKLGNDITYNPDELTIDNENDGTNDSNYEAIKGFNGHFDGQGHTVSGIRIYKSAYYGDGYQGLFGQTGSSADIRNVTLANADITGSDCTGGIVGVNYGTVSNCHVTATVAIHTIQPDVWDHGGIVGANLGTIRECISAATLTNTGNGYCTEYGGIAGYNEGTMSNNLAIGAVVPEAAENNAYGAICGWNYDGTLENNYYAACTVAGVANAVGVGCGGISDGNDGYTVADIDGAVPALRDNADNSDALALVAKIATAGFEDSPLDLGWGEGEYPMQLAGRTLYKDGSWNTLCLPFDLTLSGSILDGNNVQLMTLGDASFANGTLTLNFVKAEEIKAGVPYIIKWSEGDNIVNPVFENVTIDNASLNENAFTNSVISFKGIFSPFEITEANKKLLYMGDGNLLYYPSDAMTIGAFRAYFELQGDIECGEPESTEGINHFVLNFGGEETGIVDVDLKSISQEPGNSNLPQQYGTDGWFTLDGRRLNNKPAVKGIYVNKGKKMIIK